MHSHGVMNLTNDTTGEKFVYDVETLGDSLTLHGIHGGSPVMIEYMTMSGFMRRDVLENERDDLMDRIEILTRKINEIKKHSDAG